MVLYDIFADKLLVACYFLQVAPSQITIDKTQMNCLEAVLVVPYLNVLQFVSLYQFLVYETANDHVNDVRKQLVLGSCLFNFHEYHFCPIRCTKVRQSVKINDQFATFTSFLDY